MKIGANPLCWMNSDFPSLGGGRISVEQCLSDISRIGYEGVELEDPFMQVLDQLPKMFRSKKLACIGKWHGTHILQNGIEKEMDFLKKHLEMLSKLNAKIAILAECSQSVHQKPIALSERPRLDEEEFARLAEGLEKMAEYTRSQGFISAYHHHMGTCVQSQEDIDTLMKKTHCLGLLYDTGHLAFAKADFFAVLHNNISRITHVHCKSVRPQVLVKKLQKDSTFYSSVSDGIFTVPGDNQSNESKEAIDFKQIMATLAAHHYSGWIVMEAEQDPTKAEPFTYAQLGYQTLSSLVASIQGVAADSG